MKLLLPLYVAANVLGPLVVEIKLHAPVEVPPEPEILEIVQLSVPSETVTEPDGCPLDPERATLTNTVYAWPIFDESGASEIIDVVVLAFVTILPVVLSIESATPPPQLAVLSYLVALTVKESVPNIVDEFVFTVNVSACVLLSSGIARHCEVPNVAPDGNPDADVMATLLAEPLPLVM